MLEVQKYLRDGGTLESLESEFGITHHLHPTLPLVGLKYHQINSKHVKAHPIVRECRGTVLELDTWDLVARGFYRFFNYGEDDNFDWSNFECQEKLDGTCCIVFHYNDNWHVKTPGGWGSGQTGLIEKTTFDQLFRETLGGRINHLNPELTYIFELCSLNNKVVRTYEEPCIYLLTMFSRETELSCEKVDIHAFWSGIKRPQIYNFTSSKDLITFLENNSRDDPTFEGFVVRDRNNNRLKVKSKTYLMLHRAASTSLNRRDIIETCLKNEQDEFLTYFPEYKATFDSVVKLIEAIEVEATSLYNRTKDITNQREFAEAISTFSGNALLFQKRKHPTMELREVLLRNLSYAEKLLFKGKG